MADGQLLQVTECERCPALVACRHSIVNGRGREGARLMLVGQNPGVDEDQEGKAFIGKSGKLLRLLCDAAGIAVSDVWLVNSVRCHSPGNRVPKQDEINNCRPYLIEEIITLKPAAIVSLGQVALQSLIGMDGGVGYHQELMYWENECESIIDLWQDEVVRWQGLTRIERLNIFPNGKPKKPKLALKPKLPKKVHVTLKDSAGHTFFQQDTGIPVIPTYHPAFLMRGQWNYSEIVISHLEKARRIVER